MMKTNNEQPRACGRRRAWWRLSRADEVSPNTHERTCSPKSIPSLRWTVLAIVVALAGDLAPMATAQAPANRVLDLDGNGDWVRLPPAGFTNFHQATIEAWVKWRAFTSSARVFDFGALQREIYVATTLGATTPNSGPMKFLVVDGSGTRRRDDVYGGFRLGEWTHVAVVTGPGGVRVYLNGILAVTNDFADSLSSLGASWGGRITGRT
jgi:hypothetical protein